MAFGGGVPGSSYIEKIPAAVVSLELRALIESDAVCVWNEVGGMMEVGRERW